MDSAVVQQFLEFFQDFISLCQTENWPGDDTTESEIKNAFVIAQHVEKCTEELHKQNVMSEFINTLNNQNASSILLKSCLIDPPKYILKKIITADSNIIQMDIGLKLFIELFSEEKLEEYLTDILVEAASKETLLQHFNTELPEESLLNHKSQLFLGELITCDNPKQSIIDMLNKCSESTVELLVFSLTNNMVQYQTAQIHILEAFVTFILAKNEKYKGFWKFLFNIKDQYFIKLCTEHTKLFHYIVEALLDCGTLLKENLSMTYFYIELSMEELISIVKRITNCDDLREIFMCIIKESEDYEFWKNIVTM